MKSLHNGLISRLIELQSKRSPRSENADCEFSNL